MKHLLLTTIAAVVLVGCGESQQSIEQVKQQSRQWSEADSALFAAADEGNIEAVKQAIAAGADINTKDESLMTPLHWAANKGHKEVVELLIAKGADVNAKVLSGPLKGHTPLDRAIRFKEPETADLLRKHGGKTGEELKAAKRSLEISIHEAAKTGNIEVVKQRLASGVDVDAVDDEWSMTPLFFAANKGHVQVAEFLISAGADVNAKNRFDRTPLYRAAYWGNKEIAEILIAKGADVNTQPRDGTGTPLDWANQYGRPETANIIRENGGKTKKELKAEGKLVEPSEPVAEAAKPEPPPVKAPDISIHDAVKKGNIEAVKQHIAAGTDVNAKGGVIGGTPLYGAVAFGHKEIVELLIANGADVNEKGVDGITPLDLATAFRHRRAATIDLLRKHGGKHSSILLAAEAGNVEAVKQHLDAGADVNEKDGTGRTPLDWAERGWPRDSPEVIAARKETADLLRKHGGKTSEELKAEGK